MALKAALIFLCLVQLSLASRRLRDKVKYKEAGDYLKELDKNPDKYACDANVVITFEASKRYGRNDFLRRTRTSVNALIKKLVRLPQSPANPEMSGSTITLMPFSQGAPIKHTLEPNEMGTIPMSKWEDIFEFLKLRPSSNFYKGFVKGARHLRRQNKYYRSEGKNFLVMLTDGLYPEEHDDTIDDMYIKNTRTDITHFMIGHSVPKKGFNDGKINKDRIKKYADEGNFRYYFEPKNEEGMNKVAMKIADEIAKKACVTVPKDDRVK